MRRTAGAPALLALAALVLSGCGGGYGGGTGSSGSSPASTATGSSSSSAAGATLKTADSDLGTVVVDSTGMTVYVVDKDQPGSGKSSCSGDCLTKWPAVVADGQPRADGVDGDLGTITRDDGTKQVTLNGSPLYLFVGDSSPGDVTGQAVGGVWWVVGADGTKITEAPAASGGSSY